jgi:hypothetical protein
MNKFLLTIVLVFSGYSLYAQNNTGVKGTVVDSASNKLMEFVTIGITDLKDSTFISYTTTTKTGTFLLSGMPSDKTLVIIASHMGYSDFVKAVTLKKGEILDLGTIAMKTRSKTLNEVVVTGQRQAIMINKDTIEFRAEAFKVRPNAVVEELLKKLPGVQIDHDGGIKVAGKSVSKLTIDGKDFFSNDMRIATRNLDASLIDKVQIFDDRENDPDHLVEDSKVGKIINLKFKRAFKKSIFGKVYAGGGSRKRFESGGLFNMFRDTLQLSIITVGNNLNRTGFSSNDLSQLGGFDRSGQDGIYNGTAAVGGNTYGGIEKILSGGFNLNNDYGKKLKMNLIYFYSNSRVQRINSSSSQQFLNADTLLTTNSYDNLTVLNKHDINGSIRWMPDTNTTVNYTPRLSFNGVSNNSNGTASSFNKTSPLTQNSNNAQSNNSRTQFQHTFNYYHGFRKKQESLTITHSLNINPDQTTNFSYLNLISQTAAVRSETLDRLTNNQNRSTSAGLYINYRYPLSKKLIANASLNSSYNYNARKLLTFDRNAPTGNYDIYLDDQSTDLNRNQWTEGFNGGVSYQMNKRVSADINLSGEFLQIRNRFNKNVPDMNNNYFNFLPSVRLQVYDFSFNYSTSVSQPDIYNIQPITIRTTQLYTFTGNPSLVPSRNHKMDIRYNKYYPKSEVFIFSSGSASFDENSVVNKSEISPEGITVNMPVNRDGRRSFNINAGLNKPFKISKSLKINVNSYLGLGQTRSFIILNKNEGYQNSSYAVFTQDMSVNWKDVVELSPRYTIIPQATSYSRLSFESVKNTVQQAEVRYTVRWPKRMYWEGTYNYNFNPLVSPGFQRSTNLLNLSVALQMLKKDRGEIKLSCYDMLNQNIQNYRYAGINSITDGQSQILKRYFLLTYMIKFNKTTTK